MKNNFHLRAAGTLLAVPALLAALALVLVTACHSDQAPPEPSALESSSDEPLDERLRQAHSQAEGAPSDLRIEVSGEEDEGDGGLGREGLGGGRLGDGGDEDAGDGSEPPG